MSATLSYFSEPVADPALLPHWVPLGRLALPGQPRSVREARRFVGCTIGASHRHYDTAQLLTSELVTNAVTHTRSGRPGGALELIVSATCSALLFAVTDEGPENGLPAISETPGGPSGNGLVLVNTLSDGWGYRHSAGRTTVWFLLRAVGPPSGTPPALPASAALAPPAGTLTLLAQPHG